MRAPMVPNSSWNSMAFLSVVIKHLHFYVYKPFRVQMPHKCPLVEIHAAGNFRTSKTSNSMFFRALCKVSTKLYFQKTKWGPNKFGSCLSFRPAVPPFPASGYMATMPVPLRLGKKSLYTPYQMIG